MANRVLLNSSGLKVSKAGTNVLTAGSSGLLFSSDWSQVGLFASGSKTISWTVAGQTGRWSDSVSFGKTFATPPLVTFTLDFGDSERRAVGDASGFTFEISHEDPDLGLRYFWAAAHVTTTGLEFWARYNKLTSGWIQPNGAIGYSVAAYNL